MSSERRHEPVKTQEFKKINFLREQIRFKKVMLKSLINGSLEFDTWDKKLYERAYCVIRLDKIIYFLKLLAEGKYEEFAEQWDWEFSPDVQSVRADDDLYKEAMKSVDFLSRSEVGKKDLSELKSINDALTLMLAPIFSYSPQLVPEELVVVECVEA